MSLTAHPAEVNFGTTTSWIPLTTPSWPTNPRCSAAIYSQLGIAGRAIAYDPFYGANLDPTMICHPEVVTKWWDQGATTGIQTIQSFGPFECAGDYTTAVASKVNEVSTFIGCCPSNYAFAVSTNFGKLGQCVSSMTSGQVLTYMSLGTNAATSLRVATTTISSSTLIYGVHVNGYVFADAVQTAAASLSSTSSSGSISTGPSTTSSTSTSTSTSNNDNSNSSSGLSSSAKIGIGIGAGLGVLGLLSLALAIFFYRRRRALVSSKDGSSRKGHDGGWGNGPSEMAGMDGSAVGGGSGGGNSGGYGGKGIGQGNGQGNGQVQRVFEMSGQSRVP